MKKLFALLLCLAMIVPMCLFANAEGEFTAEPFYMLNCSPVDPAEYPYIDNYPSIRFSQIGDRIRLTYGGVALLHGSYTDEDVTKMATELKKELNARPEGLRWFCPWGINSVMEVGVVAEVYMDHSIDQVKELFTALLKKYQEIGGLLDGLVLDVEYIGMGSWYIQGKAGKDPYIYNKIVTDPRYATEIRPLLVERGFKFYEPATPLTPEIYGIHKSTGSKYDVSRSIWDTVMHNRLSMYVNEWCLEPLLTYFPDATASDYQFTDAHAWDKGINDSGSVVGAWGGNTIKAGNVSNYNFYASRPSETTFYKNDGTAVFKNPPTYIEAVYGRSAFNMFQWDANLGKRVYGADDSKRASFWLARYDYNPKQEGTLSNTPYYAEQIFHLGLLDPEPFLGYLYNQEFKDANGNVSEAVYKSRLAVINEALAELTRVAGYSDRKPIEVPMTWNREFVLSGMYTGGRNLWRITPNTEQVSLADFKIEGSDPTFYVAGQKITFPGGKIIETGNINVVGTCGYWVETPKDVTPIVVDDADRLIKIPAYIENFESYEVGTKLTSMNAREQGAWSIQSNGNDLLVEADGSNKVLAITGKSAMQNTLLPANVTIADSYAKNQVWNVTATIPAGMTAEEALILLDFGAAGQDAADGGFKISGGKVYYSDNGEYKELTLDLSAGGKYTFQRVMDLTNFTSDYIVLDASGKEVANAPAVKVPEFTGKVASIKITCENVKGKVLLDDYTLRAIGVAADFEMYDAKTGIKLAADTKNAANSAYRLSWTNITEGEKTASVVAAFYEGETLKEEKVIKEVKLTRGGDGVETGVVEVPAGQSVKLYMKSDITAGTPGTPNTPNTPNPTETQPAGQTGAQDKGGINPLMIVLIVVVVVAVAAVVLVLVLTKKKPAKKED